MRGIIKSAVSIKEEDFPSFSEGLSLRAVEKPVLPSIYMDFPSFSEGLSLRVRPSSSSAHGLPISLPFRRDFH